MKFSHYDNVGARCDAMMHDMTPMLATVVSPPTVRPSRGAFHNHHVTGEINKYRFGMSYINEGSCLYVCRMLMLMMMVSFLSFGIYVHVPSAWLATCLGSRSVMKIDDYVNDECFKSRKYQWDKRWVIGISIISLVHVAFVQLVAKRNYVVVFIASVYWEIIWRLL